MLAIFEKHVVRDEAVEPIVADAVGHGQIFPMMAAGLPPARVAGGMSRVIMEPGSMNAPWPMMTPLRMVTMGPIQTSSWMMMGLDWMGGRVWPPPAGERVMASWIRRAGSMG